MAFRRYKYSLNGLSQDSVEFRMKPLSEEEFIAKWTAQGWSEEDARAVYPGYVERTLAEEPLTTMAVEAAKELEEEGRGTVTPIPGNVYLPPAPQKRSIAGPVILAVLAVSGIGIYMAFRRK